MRRLRGRSVSANGSFQGVGYRESRPAPVKVFGAESQIFAGPQARGQRHQKNDPRRILAVQGSKALCFLWRQGEKFAFVGAGQRQVGGWILGR